MTPVSRRSLIKAAGIVGAALLPVGDQKTTYEQIAKAALAALGG